MYFDRWDSIKTMNNEDITICFKNSFETISLTIALLAFQTVWSNAIVWFRFFTAAPIDKFSLRGDDTSLKSCDQVMQVWVSRGEERRIRAGPTPELTPGPARPHSTCYSMAGSTWSKNTNFHAFMASKKSNFQIIFNITCSYWAARSSQNVLQVSNRHWETIYDTDSEQRFREEWRDLGNTENPVWCQRRITRLGGWSN